MELQTSIEIEIPIRVVFSIDPGQRLIIHPVDRAQEGIPPHVEDIEYHLDIKLEDNQTLEDAILALVEEAIDQEDIETQCMEHAEDEYEAQRDEYYDRKYHEMKDEGRI